MFRFLLLIAICALIAAPASAQIVGGSDTPETKPATGQPGTEKVAPEVHAYLEVVAKHIASDNAVIRRSAQQAVAAVGTPALPLLKELSSGEQGEKMAKEAQRLIRRIERAGDRDGKPRRRGGRTDELIGRLDLEPEQEKKVREHFEKRQTEMRQLMSQARSGEISRREAREKFRELREQMTSDLGKILPAEKAEQLRKEIERSRGERRGRGGRGRRGGVRD